VRFAWTARVLSVEEKFRDVHISGTGPEAVMGKESLGWFVRISESSAIRVGTEKPGLQPGDTVKLTMEKVP